MISAASFFPHRIGGGEVYVYRMARELIERGHAVTVLAKSPVENGAAGGTITRYKYEGIPVISYALNPSSLSQVERHSGHGERTLDALQGIADEIRPDILHINGIKPALVDICARNGIPHVVTAHHAGIACPAGTLVALEGEFCGKPAKPEHCVPCASYQRRPRWHTGGLIGRMPRTVYRPLGKWLDESGVENYLSRGLIYPWLVEKLIDAERIVFDKAQCIIAPSKSMQELLLRNGCSKDKIHLLPHGVELLGTRPIERLGERPLRFGYVGRIDRFKGIHMLLHAAQRLADGDQCEIHVFGAAHNPWDSAYLENCKSSYSGKAPLFFHGTIEPQALAAAYAIIDVLVVPSLLPEAFGLVVTEAFSAGRPVIVFDAGGLPELVRDGVDGFVITSNDSRGLAAVMKRLIDAPALVLEMANRVPAVKTIRHYVDEIEVLYAGILNTGCSRDSLSDRRGAQVHD